MNRILSLVLFVIACAGNNHPPVSPAPDGGEPIDSSIDVPPSNSPDPAGDGAFTVTETTTSIPGATAGRTLPATVFAPTTGTARPLVVVSPGFQMSRTQYTSYARHLATWGFVAVLVDYADTSFFPDHQKLADDVTAVIDWALDQPLEIDATKVATVGHSLGGKISVFAATQDARIRAVVGWDPVDSTNPSVAPQMMGSLTAAVAVVGETTNTSGGMPCAPAAENFEQFYAAAGSPALKVNVIGSDHMDWVDDPSCAFCGFCAAGSAEPELARIVTRRVDVAWLRRHLLDDSAMDGWLSNPPQLGSGAITIVTK